MDILNAFEHALDGNKITRKKWLENKKGIKYITVARNENNFPDVIATHHDGYWEILFDVSVEWIWLIDWEVFE